MNPEQNVILQFGVEKSSPLQGEVGGVLKNNLNHPFPSLQRRGLTPQLKDYSRMLNWKNLD
jgi:hypothetical protein